MNEHEFRIAYRSLVDGRGKAPRDLVQDTRVMIEAAAIEGARAGDGAKESHAVSPERRRRRSGWKTRAVRWLAAAACLATVALVAGIALQGVSRQGEEPGRALSESASVPPEQPTGVDTSESGFTVRAYAAPTNSIIDLGDNGMIVFSREAKNAASKAEVDEEGCYTGCLFSIQGVGIERVQATVSSGELYRYTVEEFWTSEEPEKWNEALSWKPTKRGTGIYAAYDDVQPFATSRGYDKEGDNFVQVRLAKRLGTTIDTEYSYSEETKEYFGLWTDKGAYEGQGKDPYEAVIDSYEGQTLTVTVQFDDGTYSTQIIELHAAYLKCVATDTAIGEAPGIRLVPEVVDPLALGEKEQCVKALYGIVVEANREPFPESLEHANEREGRVEPAMVLPRREAIEPVGARVKLGDGDVLALGDTAFIEGNSTHDDVQLSVRCLGAHSRSKRLPDGVTLDMTSMLDDFAYENQCTEQVLGYSVNEDGTINGAFSFVTVELEVRNGGRRSELARADDLGSPMLIAEDGVHLMYAFPGAPFYFEGMREDVRMDEETREITFGPGESRIFELVFVASDAVLDDPGFAWVVFDCAPAGSDGGVVAKAFELGAVDWDDH